MPEPEALTSRGLHLPASDPAAPAVEALRAVASHGPVAASAELAAFFDDPAGQGAGATPLSRSDLVTVVRLPIRRASRVAVAVGAALALATMGGVAVAATGGGQDREPAQVQQDDPSDTSTTSQATETETQSTETSTDTETTQPEASDTTDATDTAGGTHTGGGTHTANPVAAANHHDGVGSDDQHADVNGGGSVDHRALNSAHATGGSHGAKASSSKHGAGSHHH